MIIPIYPNFNVYAILYLIIFIISLLLIITLILKTYKKLKSFSLSIFIVLISSVIGILISGLGTLLQSSVSFAFQFGLPAIHIINYSLFYKSGYLLLFCGISFGLIPGIILAEIALKEISFYEKFIKASIAAVLLFSILDLIYFYFKPEIGNELYLILGSQLVFSFFCNLIGGLIAAFIICFIIHNFYNLIINSNIPNKQIFYIIIYNVTVYGFFSLLFISSIYFLLIYPISAKLSLVIDDWQSISYYYDYDILKDSINKKYIELPVKYNIFSTFITSDSYSIEFKKMLDSRDNKIGNIKIFLGTMDNIIYNNGDKNNIYQSDISSGSIKVFGNAPIIVVKKDKFDDNNKYMELLLQIPKRKEIFMEKNKSNPELLNNLFFPEKSEKYNFTSIWLPDGFFKIKLLVLYKTNISMMLNAPYLVKNKEIGKYKEKEYWLSPINRMEIHNNYNGKTFNRKIFDNNIAELVLENKLDKNYIILNIFGRNNYIELYKSLYPIEINNKTATFIGNLFISSAKGKLTLGNNKRKLENNNIFIGDDKLKISKIGNGKMLIEGFTNMVMLNLEPMSKSSWGYLPGEVQGVIITLVIGLLGWIVSKKLYLKYKYIFTEIEDK